MIATAIRQIFAAEGAGEAPERLAGVAGRSTRRRPRWRAAARAEEELLAFMAFPAEHWSKLRSTNPLERVNREVGRRSDVVGIYPNDAALIRLAGALLIEQNDEWLVGRRYLSVESLGPCSSRRDSEAAQGGGGATGGLNQRSLRRRSYTTTRDLTHRRAAARGLRP